jgi:hypothetical protein
VVTMRVKAAVRTAATTGVAPCQTATMAVVEVEELRIFEWGDVACPCRIE